MACGDTAAEIRAYHETVIGLLPNAEQRMQEIERGNTALVQQILNSRDVIGNPGVQGSSRRVFQGNLVGVLSASTGNAVYGGTGNFADEDAEIDANAVSNVWMHFKLPLHTETRNGMFHLKMTGYLYGVPGIIDETFVGYCYVDGKALIQKKTEGNYSPELYEGSDGFVYAKIKVPSTYYVTMAIDSMRVGNGPLFGVGDLVVTVTSDKEYL